MAKSKEKVAAKVVSQQEQDDKQVESMKDTEAGKIWAEIKDKTIEMFALPDQIVSMHVHPINIDPNKLYLTMNSTAVLPSLEVAIGNKYEVELVNGIVGVSRSLVPLTLKR